MKRCFATCLNISYLKIAINLHKILFKKKYFFTAFFNVPLPLEVVSQDEKTNHKGHNELAQRIQRAEYHNLYCCVLCEHFVPFVVK